MKLQAIIFFCTSMLLFSCKKNSHDSMRAYLHGEWRLVQMGSDANANGVMEASEMMDMPDTGLIATVFNPDGTGYGKIDLNQTMSMNANFTWSTDEQEQLLLIHTADEKVYHAKFKAQDTRNFYLLHEDATIMGSKVWLVYNRQ